MGSRWSLPLYTGIWGLPLVPYQMGAGIPVAIREHLMTIWGPNTLSNLPFGVVSSIMAIGLQTPDRVQHVKYFIHEIAHYRIRGPIWGPNQGAIWGAIWGLI